MSSARLLDLVIPAPIGTPLRKLTSPLPSTGPYRIASFTRGKVLTLARNTFFHEWSAGAQPAGFVDGFTWIKMANARAAANAVTEGRADLAELTPLGESGTATGSLVNSLRIEAPSRVHSYVTQGTWFGVINSTAPPFDRLKARQAFNYAVDRREEAAQLSTPSTAPPMVHCHVPSRGFGFWSRCIRARQPGISRPAV